MSITRAQLRTLQTEMQAAFDKAGFSDFTATVGSMRFGATDVNVKVTAKLKGVKSTTDAAFERKVAEYGLKMVGVKGQTLTGYKPSRYKYPFSYTTVCGAQYKATVAQAKAIFG